MPATFAQPQAGINHGLANAIRVSLEVRGMDIVEVLKILSDKGAFNLSISGNVSGRVTLFLKDVGLADAFNMAMASADLACERRGDIIFVMPARDYEQKTGSKFWDDMQMHVFTLKHAKPERVKEVLALAASKNATIVVDDATRTVVVMDADEKIERMKELVAQIDKPIMTQMFELSYAPADQIMKHLEGVLTKEVGSAKMDKMSNRLFVTDYADKIVDAARIIKAFDVRPLQVLIDAKIIEIKPSKKFYSGINWDYWLEKYFRMNGEFSIPSPSGTTDKISVGTVDMGSATAKGDARNVIDFLETFGDTRILSTPRILALNNQEAKILVGTKEAYITSTTSEIGNTAVESQAVNFVDVGVKLFVTPTINAKNEIILKIKPEISSSTRETIKTDNKETEVPIVTSSEAETTVIVNDGVSILIGGLKKTTHEKESRGVPVLGKIPFLGAAFSSKRDDWSREELVIVLTPRIVQANAGDKDPQPAFDDGHAIKTKEDMPDAATMDAAVEKTERLTKGLPAPEDAFSAYYCQMRDIIIANLPDFPAKQGVSVHLRFALSPNGDILGNPNASSPYCNRYWTEAIEESVRRNAPYPPPPIDSREKSMTFEVDITL